MNEHLLIRIAATRRASDIGGNHEGESAATGVSTYEFNTREREATLGVISYDTGFHCGVLGCSISGQRCSAGNYFLYANAWFQSGHAELAGLRPGFNRWPQVNLERAWGIWVATNVRWPSTRARRMEPCAPSGPGFACAHCGAEKGEAAF